MTSAQQNPETQHMLTQPEIERLLRERALAEPVDAVLAKEGCHCVDGRGEHPETYGLAGGDLGPLSAILAAAEELSGTSIEKGTVLQVLARIPGKVYLHTDDHALHAIHGPLGAELHARSAEELVTRGPVDPAHRAQVAAALADPACVGCGHMKQIITQQEQDADGPYRMRAALGRTVLSAAYEHAWQQQDHSIVESLHGEHEEAAVTVVTVKDFRGGATVIPAVRPCAHDAADHAVQTFVNQPQVGEYRLDQLLPLVVAQVPVLKGREAALRKRASEIFNLQTGETVKRLATSKGKPVFAATFDKDALLDVQEVQ